MKKRPQEPHPPKKKKEPEPTKPAKEEKEKEPTFEIKQNPARVTIHQLKYISFDVDPRYVPVKKGENFGIVLLKDQHPDQPEEFVSLTTTTSTKEEKEPEPPEPFEFP